MKRRNAETGKLRRPVKRTKITEGMYGNSMIYLKFVMLWATVVMADHMLEFRFEFLWPLWMMFRSVYDSFKYQGLIFSMFFVCIALTSDMICFFFIPLQYMFFAASTYVWVQYVWYTFADKGVCVPTVALCCLVVYAEGALRGGRGSLDLCRPLAAHSVGYPIVTLGVTVKSYVRHRLWVHRQRMMIASQVFQVLKTKQDAAPPPEQNHESPATSEASTESVDSKYVNGGPRKKKMVDGKLLNGDYPCTVPSDNLTVHEKFEYLAKHLEKQMSWCDYRTDDLQDNHEPCKMTASANLQVKSDKKSEKKEPLCTVKEEKRRNKNKDKDKDNTEIHNHKNTEQTKEQIVKDKEKDIESTKEIVKNHKDNSSSTRDKEDLKREKEQREKDKEREREREREQRLARESAEELRRARAELAVARAGEAEARATLAAAIADMAVKSKASWRCGEKAALERKLCEERRARTHAETLLRNQSCKTSATECDNEMCKSRVRAAHAECSSLRRDLSRAKDKLARLTRDLAVATDQVRSLEARPEEGGGRLAGACAALQERAAHLERSLSAETRVKLDLLSALGHAKRQLQHQETLISRQEKELEELKAQMLAVMPAEYIAHSAAGRPKFRLSDGSPLDPNATVYTPKRLCSDA